MEKYIPLDAVLEKIDKLDEFWHLSKSNVGQAVAESLRSSINALEVKEVDLEKEYKDFIKSDNGRSMFETAKHFYELGLRTQKGK